MSDIALVFDLAAARILPANPALCAYQRTTVFAQRRYHAAFAAITAGESHLRNVVVRQSLAEDRIRAQKARRKRETMRLLADVLRIHRLNEPKQTRGAAAVRSNQAAAVYRP